VRLVQLSVTVWRAYSTASQHKHDEARTGEFVLSLGTCEYRIPHGSFRICVLTLLMLQTRYLADKNSPLRNEWRTLQPSIYLHLKLIICDFSIVEMYGLLWKYTNRRRFLCVETSKEEVKNGTYLSSCKQNLLFCILHWPWYSNAEIVLQKCFLLTNPLTLRTPLWAE
jgi:hypothetical protein